MKPEAELEACRQALRQYRAAWNELRVIIASREEPIGRPGFVVEMIDAIGQKHNLPVENQVGPADLSAAE